jgi:ATP-dependent Clp protease ATP-binding subunit ClpA
MFERFTTPARGVVTGAQQAARELHHPTIGTEHVLIAMLEADGPVRRLLTERGVSAATVREDIERHIGVREPGPVEADTDAEDAAALKAIGIDLDKVRAAIEENFGPGALRLPRPAERRGFFGKLYASGGHIPFSPRAKKVLELSLREALRLNHKFIAPEHLMLGILREGQGLAARILADRNVDFGRLREDLTRELDAAAA